MEDRESDATETRSNLRTLAPQDQNSLPNLRPVNVFHKSRTRQACERCRAMRTKCSGTDPCGKCIADGVPCAYGEKGREKAKRTQANLQAEVDGLREELRISRESNSALQTILRDQRTALNAFRDASDEATPPTDSGEAEQSNSETPITRKISQWVASHDELPDAASTAISPRSSSNTRDVGVPSTYDSRVHGTSQGRSSVHAMLDSEQATPFSSVNSSDRSPHTYDNVFGSNVSDSPESQMLPRIIYDDDPLSRVASDYMIQVKRRVSQGTDISHFIGDERTDVQIYFRDRNDNDPMTVSSWACELQKAFHGSYPCSLQLAQVYMLTRLVRWLLAPSKSTFEALPTMMRPTTAQLLHPHPMIVDMLPLPPMRDAMIVSAQDIVQATTTAGVIVDWPGGLSDIVTTDTSTGAVYLRSEFTSHISDPRNWIVGSAILDNFLTLKGTVNISKERFVTPDDLGKDQAEFGEFQRQLQVIWRMLKERNDSG